MVDLKQRAEAFEDLVETSLVDATGLLLSALDSRTMKPFARGFFTGDLDFIRSPGADIGEYADLMAYENSGMVSGAYLCAMLGQYDATRDPRALDRAYRTFEGIRTLFNRCQEVEPGYLCKPYGGQITRETSSDQYIYVLTALDRFCKIAGRAERDQAVAMIAALSRYWMDHDYTRDYFGKPLRWRLNRFTGFAWLNYVHTGDPAMRRELDRLAALPEVRETLPFAELDLAQLLAEYETRPKLHIERRSGRMLLHGGAETAQSGTQSIDACLEYNAPHRDLWLRQLKGLIDRGRLSVQPDGRCLLTGFYNPGTGRLEPVDPPGDVNGEPHPDAFYKFMTFAGKIYTGMAAPMFARALVNAHLYLRDPELPALARRILERADQAALCAYHDPDGHLPPPMRWHLHTFSGDAVAHWLWAYWQGRARGCW